MKNTNTAAREAAIKPSKKKSTSLPVGPDYIPSPLEIACKLIPEDLEFLVMAAAEYGIPLPIVAGVAASMGESLIRLPSAHVVAPMDHGPSNYIWMVINRDLEDYTAASSVFVDQDYLYMVQMDSESLKRSAGDWLASLIHVGIHLMRCTEARRRHCGYGGLEGQLQALAYVSVIQGGPVIKATPATLNAEVAA